MLHYFQVHPNSTAIKTMISSTATLHPDFGGEQVFYPLSPRYPLTLVWCPAMARQG